MEREYSIIACGRSYNPPDWYYNPKNLVNRIYYICGGTAYYRGDVRLKPGHLYIFRGSPYFQVGQDENDPVDHVFFDFVTYKRLINEDFIEIDLTDENPKNKKLKSYIDYVTEDFEGTFYPLPVAKAFLDIIIYHLEDYLNSDVVYSQMTSTVLKYIHETPFDELSVSKIADDLNVNVNHLIRSFKKELNITPHKYISMMKADYAISYMRQGTGCAEIAERLGFSSISAFSSFFKKETGRNISEYG